MVMNTENIGNKKINIFEPLEYCCYLNKFANLGKWESWVSRGSKCLGAELYKPKKKKLYNISPLPRIDIRSDIWSNIRSGLQNLEVLLLFKSFLHHEVCVLRNALTKDGKSTPFQRRHYQHSLRLANGVCQIDSIKIIGSFGRRSQNTKFFIGIVFLALQSSFSSHSPTHPIWLEFDQKIQPLLATDCTQKCK